MQEKIISNKKMFYLEVLEVIFLEVLRQIVNLKGKKKKTVRGLCKLFYICFDYPKSFPLGVQRQMQGVANYTHV